MCGVCYVGHEETDNKIDGLEMYCLNTLPGEAQRSVSLSGEHSLRSDNRRDLQHTLTTQSETRFPFFLAHLSSEI